MGLDMYLSAKKFIQFDFNEKDPDKRPSSIQCNPLTKDLVAAGFKSGADYGEGLRIQYIEVSVGYWRKANQIHQWFVDNVQDGNDDCGTYSVEREQLKELMELCQTVLLVPGTAGEALPPQEGFFFGGTSIDEYYFEDLRETVKIIETALKIPDDYDFQYHSSW